ncbi:hypothetical protein CRE_17274 [Caenorhabditis remanei]|uniref:Uncharacterized protein n=1 Tax=Caenorhabditis remanei TaxID=31234 RepID=E3MAH7_CAERE|nr:hypothetical protein CRE_17274 [Caenorhabditis remanei]
MNSALQEQLRKQPGFINKSNSASQLSTDGSMLAGASVAQPMVWTPQAIGSYAEVVSMIEKNVEACRNALVNCNGSCCSGQKK